MKAKVAIVGASIAGAAAAIIMRRAGVDVTLFEQRGRNSMVGSGAGIMLPKNLVEQLIQQNIFSSDFPLIDLTERKFITYDAQENSVHYLSQRPLTGCATHWKTIYESLQCRLDVPCHYDTKIVSISENDQVVLQDKQGKNYYFDYVIFADGYASLGRKYLFPDLKPEFGNYIAWRGILPNSARDFPHDLLHQAQYHFYKNGHLLLYAIPGKPQGNDHLINWVFYERLDPQHPLCVDGNEGKNISPEMMTTKYRNYLHQLAQKSFSPEVCEIIVKTEKPFVQAIYDVTIPYFFKNRIALTGDASVLLRPHVGSGAATALEAALSLGNNLETQESLKAALENWSAERLLIANNLFKLGRSLAEFLVLKMPDFKQLSGAELEALWDQAIAGRSWYLVVKQ